MALETFLLAFRTFFSYLIPFPFVFVLSKRRVYPERVE